MVYLQLLQKRYTARISACQPCLLESCQTVFQMAFLPRSSISSSPPGCRQSDINPASSCQIRVLVWTSSRRWSSGGGPQVIWVPLRIHEGSGLGGRGKWCKGLVGGLLLPNNAKALHSGEQAEVNLKCPFPAVGPSGAVELLDAQLLRKP